MRPWVTFFTQTGTEIYNLSNELGIYPDAIITNRSELKGINEKLLELIKFREHKLNTTILHFLPNKPVIIDYLEILKKFNNPVITLHGYLRILPEPICKQYEIYNLHPGLIDKYPALKGYNPQERAFTEGYKLAGCVIHRVVPEVDEGEILISQGTCIEKLDLPGVYNALHGVAFDLWKSFFKTYKMLEK